MIARKRSPSYSSLPTYRKREIGAKFNEALSTVEQRGRKAGLPQASIDAMRKAIVRFPKDSITQDEVNKVYQRYARK